MNFKNTKGFSVAELFIFKLFDYKLTVATVYLETAFGVI